MANSTYQPGMKRCTSQILNGNEGDGDTDASTEP